jgi:hypothetical protein
VSDIIKLFTWQLRTHTFTLCINKLIEQRTAKKQHIYTGFTHVYSGSLIASNFKFNNHWSYITHILNLIYNDQTEI